MDDHAARAAQLYRQRRASKLVSQFALYGEGRHGIDRRAFSLTHILSPPGHSTPLHLHHHEDEVFWVLDGEHGFYCEGKTTVLGPGGYMFLPRGIRHGNRVVGDRPATMLVLAMPGTGFVGMMQEVGQPAKARVLPEPAAPDVERLTGIAEKYGIEILGPLPE